MKAEWIAPQTKDVSVGALLAMASGSSVVSSDVEKCSETGAGGCGSCSRIFHVGRFFRLPRPKGGGVEGRGAEESGARGKAASAFCGIDM